MVMDPAKEKGLFHDLLHDLLEEVEKNDESDIISWSADGLCFKVHKKEEFVERILKRYYRLTQYKSFIRQREYCFNPRTAVDHCDHDSTQNAAYR